MPYDKNCPCLPTSTNPPSELVKVALELWFFTKKSKSNGTVLDAVRRKRADWLMTDSNRPMRKTHA